MTSYPPPPGRPDLGWPVSNHAAGPAGDPGSGAVGAPGAGSSPSGAAGDGLDTGPGRPAGDNNRSYRQCVAVNKTDRHEGRCSRPIRRNDPNDVCTAHRAVLNRGRPVRHFRGGWIEPPPPPEHVPSSDVELFSVGSTKTTGRINLSLDKVDFASLKNAENREKVQNVALAAVLTVLQDPYARDADRLKAAGMILPPGGEWALPLLGGDLEVRDLDEEVFAITEHLELEYLARAEKLNNADVLKLLSPKARTIVLTELAEHGLHWSDDESEAS